MLGRSGGPFSYLLPRSLSCPPPFASFLSRPPLLYTDGHLGSSATCVHAPTCGTGFPCWLLGRDGKGVGRDRGRDEAGVLMSEDHPGYADTVVSVEGSRNGETGKRLADC
mgnify:CR=1 FL=1